MKQSTPDWVTRQYRTEAPLETRRAVWQDSEDGRNPADRAAAAICAARPSAVLEVGCGTGGFAERVSTQNPGVRVVATDLSPRFVELTAARGVETCVANATSLPFTEDEFDVVAALWMLYHVADLDAALAEVRRVLRPGGLFVAVTNGDEHTVDLRRAAGGEPLVTGFSTENGAVALRRHFDVVEQEDIATRAVFPDHAAATAYLASFDERLAANLPAFDGPWQVAGATTVFLAR